MQLRTLDLALTTQRAVAPLVRRVQRHDRKLAQQLRDATNSFVLNLGEGAYSDLGTRRARYQSSAGSASEVRVGLLAAVGWGYFDQADAHEALSQLDHLLASLWKLTH
ncbi:MAG: four helix bundle protein [Polyangiaceae bacterium]|nr:four helix bundle protein [Polyangiaceae bacterium]